MCEPQHDVTWLTFRDGCQNTVSFRHPEPG